MSGTTKAQRARRRLVFGMMPAGITMGIFLLVPLALVVMISLVEGGRYGGVIWSFDNGTAYERLLYTPRLDGTVELNVSFLTIFARSLMLAAMTTLICFLIAFPAAFYISRCPAWAKNILLLLIMFPFWSNLLVRTTSWIILLRDQGLVNQMLMGLGLTSNPLTLLYTNGSILVGLVYVYIPFMILPIFTSLERLDFRLVEASFDLFASRMKTLRHVILPLTIPGIAAGSILVFIPSLGAFITPDLLGGGKKLMLGSLIQMQFTTGRNWPYGASLSVLLLALVLVALFLNARMAVRRKSQGTAR